MVGPMVAANYSGGTDVIGSNLEDVADDGQVHHQRMVMRNWTAGRLCSRRRQRQGHLADWSSVGRRFANAFCLRR